jgi:hypothetical protein
MNFKLRYIDGFWLILIPTEYQLLNDSIQEWLSEQGMLSRFYPTSVLCPGLLYFTEECFATLFALKFGCQFHQIH